MAHSGIDMIRGLFADHRDQPADLLERRERLAKLAGSSPAPDGVTVEATRLGGCRAERLTPPDAPANQAVLYLHGGGYCSGSIDTHRALAGALALAAGVTVYVVDYRLAPENPFPAALDDTVAAFDEIGVSRVAIAGDSAGGGLAVATALALRDRGGAVPVALACFSPWVDLTQTAASMTSAVERDPMLTGDALTQMAQGYLGSTDPRTPLASPLHADLGGLPPLLIDVGSDEVLLDDATELARLAKAAGVPTALTVWPDMIHVFQAFPPTLVPEAAESLSAAGAFLRAHLSG